MTYSLNFSKPLQGQFSMRRFLSLSLALSVVLFATLSHAKDISGKAPDFTLKSNSGKNLQLSDFRGQIVLINFWATWCGPCRQEMPKLNEIHKRYQRAGVTVLGVNVEDDSNLADDFLSKNPVDFPILYDTTSKVSELYKVDAMPYTVLVDADGEMFYLHRGYKAGDEKAYTRRIKSGLRALKH